MKKLINKAWTNVFFQGSIFLTVSNLVVVFLNYLFNIFAARALGPSDFGEIATFFSYIVILTTPTGILSSYFLVKIGGSNKPDSFINTVFHSIDSFIKKNWLFFAIPSIILIPFIPHITNLSQTTAYFIIPTVLITYYLSAYESALQGLHLFLLFAIFGIIFTAVKLIGAVLVISFSQGLGIIMFFIFLAFVIKLMLNVITIKKKLITNKIQHTSYNVKQLFADKQLQLTFISTSAITFISNFDIIYVKKFFSDESAGIFASWLLFTKVITIVLGPIISLSFVLFSNKKYELQHQIFFIGTWILLALTGFASLMVYGLYSRLFIDIFLGAKFYPVIPYIEWASLAGTAYMMLFFMNNYYLAKGSKKVYILACGLPLYITALFIYGKEIGDVMLINIWFSFSIIAIYLLLFFKARLMTLFE